ncbi:hypothetical protein [Pseudooceanicola sp. LIPI14-2-Ac024]|uniref:hypothetical protein n=1 Tax=Pseudooceanicola sp. LIPI14-2-Ac024 TaxID=3344875 RepID=UPI0035D092BD
MLTLSAELECRFDILDTPSWDAETKTFTATLSKTYLQRCVGNLRNFGSHTARAIQDGCIKTSPILAASNLVRSLGAVEGLIVAAEEWLAIVKSAQQATFGLGCDPRYAEHSLVRTCSEIRELAQSIDVIKLGEEAADLDELRTSLGGMLTGLEYDIDIARKRLTGAEVEVRRAVGCALAAINEPFWVKSLTTGMRASQVQEAKAWSLADAYTHRKTIDPKVLGYVSAKQQLLHEFKNAQLHLMLPFDWPEEVGETDDEDRMLMMAHDLVQADIVERRKENSRRSDAERRERKAKTDAVQVKRNNQTVKDIMELTQ